MACPICIVVLFFVIMFVMKMTNVSGRNASSHSTPLLFIEKDLQSPSVPVPCRRKENLKSRGSVHYSANILSSQLNTKHGFFLDCGTSLLKNMQMLFSNCRPI